MRVHSVQICNQIPNNSDAYLAYPMAIRWCINTSLIDQNWNKRESFLKTGFLLFGSQNMIIQVEKRIEMYSKKNA